MVLWGLDVLSLRLRGLKYFMRTLPATVPGCLSCLLLYNERPQTQRLKTMQVHSHESVDGLGSAALHGAGQGHTQGRV